MQPIFDIITGISEEDFRKITKKNALNPKYFFDLVIMIVFSVFFVWLFFNTSDSFKGLRIFFLLFALLTIYTISRIIVYPTKQADVDIQDIIMRTGKSDLKHRQCFFENELTSENLYSKNKCHLSYEMVNKICEYNNILVIYSPQLVLYIDKKDIADNKAFHDFIWSKCPNAQYKKMK